VEPLIGDCGSWRRKTDSLKHAVAELLLDKRALQAVITKKW